MIASADVPLDQVFSTEKTDDGFISDEHRKLMDDLQISPDSVHSINIVSILLLEKMTFFFNFV